MVEEFLGVCKVNTIFKIIGRYLPFSFRGLGSVQWNFLEGSGKCDGLSTEMDMRIQLS